MLLAAMRVALLGFLVVFQFGFIVSRSCVVMTSQFAPVSQYTFILPVAVSNCTIGSGCVVLSCMNGVYEL